MYAALNTVEPPVLNLFAIDVVNPGEDWAKLRRPAVAEEVDKRLAALSDRLFERDYVTGRFSAADILMATVLRFLHKSNAVEAHPLVAAYLRRCEGRPGRARAHACRHRIVRGATCRAISRDTSPCRHRA